MKHRKLAALCFASVLACNGNAKAQFVEDLEILVMAESDEHGDFFGWYVTPLSDANGDGVTDFAVARTFLGNFRGGVTVYSGADGSEIWSFCETEPSAITGFSLGVIDDINGDGVDEVVAGAPLISSITPKACCLVLCIGSGLQWQREGPVCRGPGNSRHGRER